MSKLLEDKEGNTSSKRLAGFIISGVGLSSLLFLGIFSIFRVIKDPSTAMESFKTILYVGSGLLGLGVFEHFGGKK